jgi:hypothetical protein
VESKGFKENIMIECSMCGKKGKHYTEDRDTTIGCYQFSYPLERKYVCDECIISYINKIKEKGIKREWWPFEIRR